MRIIIGLRSPLTPDLPLPPKQGYSKYHDAYMGTIKMRTTLTIEDRLAEELKRTAHSKGQSFKQVVNEALRAGLNAQARPPARPYHLEPTPMGRAKADTDLTKARQLSDEMEDATLAGKLEQRK